MCFKPPPPKMEGVVGSIVEPMMEKIIPCVIITPADCFWDGSKPLGPHEPLELPDLVSCELPFVESPFCAT